MEPQRRSGESDRTDGRARLDVIARAATRLEPNRRTEQAPSGLARLTRIGARGRLEGELRLIAVDLLGPNESDESPADCAEWVAAATEAAVSKICDSTLEELVEALDSLLVDIPPDVARHLDQAKARHEAGFV